MLLPKKLTSITLAIRAQLSKPKREFTWNCANNTVSIGSSIIDNGGELDRKLKTMLRNRKRCLHNLLW